MVPLVSPIPQHPWWGLGHGLPGVKGGKTLSRGKASPVLPPLSRQLRSGSEPAVLHALLERILRQLSECLRL